MMGWRGDERGARECAPRTPRETRPRSQNLAPPQLSSMAPRSSRCSGTPPVQQASGSRRPSASGNRGWCGPLTRRDEFRGLPPGARDPLPKRAAVAQPLQLPIPDSSARFPAKEKTGIPSDHATHSPARCSEGGSWRLTGALASAEVMLRQCRWTRPRCLEERAFLAGKARPAAVDRLIQATVIPNAKEIPVLGDIDLFHQRTELRRLRANQHDRSLHLQATAAVLTLRENCAS